MPLSSSVHRENAIWLPSGDHAGLIHFEGWFVSRSNFSEPMVFTYRSNPLSESPFHANAISLPSGEKLGVTSWPGRLVNGTVLTAEKFPSLVEFLKWIKPEARSRAKQIAIATTPSCFPATRRRFARADRAPAGKGSAVASL